MFSRHRKPAFIRRQYYKLAAKYHPDKNPEGREMFERINAAYELLSSETANNSGMPDSHRIVLCLQAQSIIYSRYSQGNFFRDKYLFSRKSLNF